MLAFAIGGVVGISAAVAGVIVGARLARPSSIDPREVQRRIEGRER